MEKVSEYYSGVAYTPAQYRQWWQCIRTKDGMKFFLLDKTLTEEERSDLYKTFPKGTITSTRKIIGEMLTDARLQLESLIDSIEDALDNDCFSTIQGLRSDAGDELWSYATKLLAEFYIEELENIYLNN